MESRDRVVRNGMHLFQSSSQCKSKVMRLTVPDTRERLPILHSDTEHRQNIHANPSQPLIPHVKRVQLSAAVKCPRES